MASDDPTPWRVRLREEPVESQLERRIVRATERAPPRQLDDVGGESGPRRGADQWCVCDGADECAREEDERGTRCGRADPRDERPDPVDMSNGHRTVGLARQLSITRRTVRDERPADEDDRAAESQGDPDTSNVSPEFPSIHRRPTPSPRPDTDRLWRDAMYSRSRDRPAS